MSVTSTRLVHTSLALVLLGPGLSSCTIGQTSGVRASGQSRLMDDTFAGQNACDPEDHNKPFIIEWDATDMSSFESFAANDIVIVKYEGCKLRVLDECRNDSIRGEQGAYKPPEWTSGSLETIDIHNEGELYAKLPLGKATLGGRVAGGETFHMEYFVAGTTYATRETVYRDDIDDNPGCESATHFVYAYNLGAFALGSANDFVAEAGGSAFGYGGGGSKSSGRVAEKKGGDLSTCTAADATEVLGCKTPIRLNLRKIRDGTSPESEALAAPDTDASVSAAGAVSARVDASEDAEAHWEAAKIKMAARDGNGCLAELDAHDELDPNHKSTDPKVVQSQTRAQCLMLTGKCEAGKALVRKHLAYSADPKQPDEIDKEARSKAIRHCQGGDISERDLMLQSIRIMQQGIEHGETVENCEKAFRTSWELMPKIAAKGPEGPNDELYEKMHYTIWVAAPGCMAKAGDCKRAWELMNITTAPIIQEQIDRGPDRGGGDPYRREMFQQLTRGSSCEPPT